MNPWACDVADAPIEDPVPVGDERPARYTVRFQDEGQDFLEWDLDNWGNVVDCRPFQAWIWIRYRVLNPLENLRAGHTLMIVPRDNPMADAEPLHYRVAEVREVLS